VKSIIRRYNRALENVVDVRIAFEQLNSAAPAHCVADWESSIEAAEMDRVNKPSSMDVMQSTIRKGRTMKQIAADIMREDGLEMSQMVDNGDHTDWILEGLNLEDEQ